MVTVGTHGKLRGSDKQSLLVQHPSFIGSLQYSGPGFCKLHSGAHYFSFTMTLGGTIMRATLQMRKQRMSNLSEVTWLTRYRFPMALVNKEKSPANWSPRVLATHTPLSWAKDLNPGSQAALCPGSIPVVAASETAPSEPCFLVSHPLEHGLNLVTCFQ